MSRNPQNISNVLTTSTSISHCKYYIDLCSFFFIVCFLFSAGCLDLSTLSAFCMHGCFGISLLVLSHIFPCLFAPANCKHQTRNDTESPSLIALHWIAPIYSAPWNGSWIARIRQCSEVLFPHRRQAFTVLFGLKPAYVVVLVDKACNSNYVYDRAKRQ